MQYYIFDEISPNKQAPFLELPDEIDLIETLKGEQPNFEELPIKMFAEVDDDVVFTDILNPGIMLFSSKMKNTLDANGVTNIDYYPVEIIDEDSKEKLCEYNLGVIQDIIPCIDIEKTTFKENIYGKSVITEFCIDHTRTKNLQLFRLHNIPGLVIINQTLKEALCSFDFKGVSFKNTLEYKRDAL